MKRLLIALCSALLLSPVFADNQTVLARLLNADDPSTTLQVTYLMCNTTINRMGPVGTCPEKSSEQTVSIKGGSAVTIFAPSELANPSIFITKTVKTNSSNQAVANSVYPNILEDGSFWNTNKLNTCAVTWEDTANVLVFDSHSTDIITCGRYWG